MGGRLASPPSPQRLDGVARARMSEVQRRRLLAATVEVVGESHYAGMSMARVTARAGISRRTFYELFDDREDCFLAAFEDALERIEGIAVPAYEREKGWRAQVRSGLSSVLEFIGDEPVVGTLVIVDSLGAGSRVLERRALGLASLARIVDKGREEGKASRVPPPLTAEGVVGAVLSVIHARLLEPDPRPPIDLLNPLMAMIVSPYLGRVAATRELAHPAPKAHRAPREPAGDPLADLPMRVTYRTLNVLAVIATRPGASNREIGEHAGISDQGQISRLLARLQKLELVRNTGHGQARGEPNAWTLTTKGSRLHNAVDA